MAKVKVGVKAEVKDDGRDRTYYNKLLDYEKGDRLLFQVYLALQAVPSARSGRLSLNVRLQL